MFCTKCGYRLTGGMVVCPKCGNAVPQQGRAQESFKSVDEKFDRNEYIRKYGDVPDMSGFGVDMFDDRMGETIELKNEVKANKPEPEDLDVTSVIRAEDAPEAVRRAVPGESAMQDMPMDDDSESTGALPGNTKSAAQQAQNAAQSNISQGVSQAQGAAAQAGSQAQGASGYFGAGAQNQNTAGSGMNPDGSARDYFAAKKDSGSKKPWIISGALAVLALVTAIGVSTAIKNDGASKNKKVAENAAAWGEGFREKHILKHVDAVIPTVNAAGQEEYWHCDFCGKDFSDAAGENEVDTTTLVTYVFDKNLSGITEYSDGKLYMVKNGVCDSSFSGFEKYNDEMYYFKNGVQDASFTGLSKDGEELIYIKDGKSDNTFTGFADSDNEWYYVTNGKVDKTVVDVIKGIVNNEEAWWYVKDGKVTITDIVAKNSSGWWNIKQGKVDFKDGIGENEQGKWYCPGGKVNFDLNAVVEFEGKFYQVKGGKIEKELTAEEAAAAKEASGEKKPE
ncbi:MAG: zinc ribbon domain-containing protein [Eubacterium sp.]|nr:zinc ribbon domain-containing protein [Eubacterium sp.]